MKRKVSFLAFVFISLVFIGFNVSAKCDDYELEIVDFYPCDRLGNFQDVFEIGSEIYFNLTIRNLTSDPKNVSICITVYDCGDVPIGVELFNTTVLPDSYEYYMINITIPQWAYVGNGTAYANIFEGKIPIVLERGTNVIIIPEFPSFIIIPLFMIATLLAVILYRRKHPM